MNALNTQSDKCALKAESYSYFMFYLMPTKLFIDLYSKGTVYFFVRNTNTV